MVLARGWAGGKGGGGRGQGGVIKGYEVSVLQDE